jgi:hypothetical protein
MNIRDETFHKREVFAHYAPNDLSAILTKHLAEQTNFVIDPRKTRISVRFDNRDTSTGYETHCLVTMTNELPAIEVPSPEVKS